jgi:hypothetical protein
MGYLFFFETLSFTMTDDTASPRESTDSSNTQESKYTSRFREHMSQAYSTYPDDWPFPKSESGSPKSHKHSNSVESFASTLTTSSKFSTSSFNKFRKLALRIKSVLPPRQSIISTPYSEEHTIRGSSKTFRKEDIKVAGLRESSNLMHYI